MISLPFCAMLLRYVASSYRSNSSDCAASSVHKQMTVCYVNVQSANPIHSMESLR